MKISITGHTRGIGLAIKNYFENQGHEVIGFSRETGYDLQHPSIREKVVSLSKDSDIFVNNAYGYGGEFQFSLLKRIYKSWEGKNKTIINISTRFTGGDDIYSARKKTMDEFCETNIYHLPNIINIKPGLVDTDRVKAINDPKMSTDDVVKILDWILHQPIKIHSITFGK